MSANCCSDKKFDGVSERYKRILLVVIALNALMFVVEIAGGIFSKSQTLQADALDFLADSLTYAMSLWEIGRSLKLRSNVAIAKGLSLAAMGGSKSFVNQLKKNVSTWLSTKARQVKQMKEFSYDTRLSA